MTKHLVAIPSLVLLAGCGEVGQPTEHAAAKTTIAVRTNQVRSEELPSTYEATGTVRARTTASISSKLMAYVHDVKVQIGERVKEGQVLISLDGRDLDANLRRAEAARAEVGSIFPEAESGVTAAKANLDLLQVTFNRMQDLYIKKSISNQEFDEASGKVKSAQAAYDMARAKRAQLDERLAQAVQEVRAAQINLSYAEITSPFEGTVTGRSVEPGNLANPGTSLLTIEREGSYRIEALVDESRLPTIHIGQPVTIKLDGLGRILNGKVSEIVPEVDAASRSGTVKIDLPAIAELRPGVFGRVQFASSPKRRILTVLAGAVSERGQLQSVLVAENGTARTRLVTLGAKLDDRAEVLSGLNEGDTVIVPVPQGLTDGARVEILP